MANTKENVLTGVATLSVREPNDSYAGWSTEEQYAGSWSAKLKKTGTGDAGSTCLEANITASTSCTMATCTTATWTNFSYYYKNLPVATVGNYQQFELRFEDPNSDAWVEVTVVEHQTHTALGAWTLVTLADADVIGYGGVNEVGLSFSDWDLGSTLSSAVADVDTTFTSSCADWQLARVRIELWESYPSRTCYIDSVTINSTAYTVEPGGTLPGMTFRSADTEVGYTEDGVTIEYSADTADIDVEEETFSIDRVITKETCSVTCNMAESSLVNMAYAMPGSVRSGALITLGAGAMKTMNLKIEGTNPAGYTRRIIIPKATASGSVGMAYKNGEKTIVPVTFMALKTDEAAVTIDDNAA